METFGKTIAQISFPIARQLTLCPNPWASSRGASDRHSSIGCCQTNRLKHQKHEEREFYEAIRERHSVRAASRFSLKVLRFESDLCELK